jgi:Zn-finger nucleic acid-binding protein
MHCPTDGATLVMSERSGIEIDYCPDCRGVWLDRGELDKIIERSLGQAIPQPSAPAEHQHHRPEQQGYRKPKRRESWLSELFD